LVHKIGHDLGLEGFDEGFCEHLILNLVEEVERVWVENWYLDIKVRQEDVKEDSKIQFLFP